MPVTKGNESHYKTEINTASLIRAVLLDKRMNDLTGEKIWALLQLTWITKGRGTMGRTTFHWKKLQVGALATLFAKTNLPIQVRTAAEQRTGFVNAYRPYRNSLKDWCKQHAKRLRSILEDAKGLGSDNRDRLDLASRIAGLPRVPTPNNVRTKCASDFITPLVACLDPKSRFPIINGASGVKRRLAKLGLAKCSLREQTEGFISLIDESSLRDAFDVDTMSQDQISKIKPQVPHV